MLHDTIEHSAIDMQFTPTWTSGDGYPSEPRWRTVDRTLRQISARRAALDAEEARWLREAEALQIWRPLGMVSALDYLERVLGYAPRTAHDRLRVARALGDLPQLTAALAGSELPFSAVRELTRVATPATEASWIAAATGKNLRQIEELVADHRPGDRPDDPPDPQARTHVVRFELPAETFALLRQARTALDDEHGTNLADDAFVAALCNAVLDGAPQTEPTGRARFQIAVTVCQHCRRGRQEGAGAQIPIDAAAVDRALCDAQHIGSIDAPAPERAYQDIPPSVARFVWHRDGGRCRVDGCRSARGLEHHHVVHRADGGSHDAKNIVLLCSACHLAHHRGTLMITGTADQLEVHRPGHAASVTDARDVRTNAGSIVDVGTAGVAPIASPRAHVGAAHMMTQTANADLQVQEGSMTTPIASPRAHVGTAEVTAPIAPAPVDMGAPDVTTPIAPTRAQTRTTSRLDAAILRNQAKTALIGLGWKPAIAQAAIAAAAAAQGAEMTLERLIFESLRRCPVPRA